MSKILVSQKKADFNALSKEFHISPVFARILVNRDISDINKYLNGTREDIDVPSSLLNMHEAAMSFRKDMEMQKKIRIIGDYDVDGITSTTILYKSFSRFNRNIDFYIPDRITDGYGLNEKIIQKCIEDNVEVILTCDNGISAIEPIQKAKEAGIKVIVTDHHECPVQIKEDGTKEILLPNADYIIDPKQPGDTSVFKEICGAVVSMKFVQEVFGKEIPEECWALAALGTICDVMPLIDDNRLIVKEGLKHLYSNPGLRALILANEKRQDTITASDIAFVIGPCINATGRLASASIGVSLLLEQNEDLARDKAIAIKNLNEKRKILQKEAVQLAEKEIERHMADDAVLVCKLDVHESIAGPIAGNLKETYGKPVIVLTPTENGVLKGSARSTSVYDIHEALNYAGHLLIKHGGHKGAAGLSLVEENLESFRQEINKRVKEEHLETYEEPIIKIDVPIPLDYLTLDMVRELKQMEPVGNGNPYPLFADKESSILNCSILGAEKNVAKYNLKTKMGKYITGIIFQSKNIQKFESFIHKDKNGNSLESFANAGLVYEPILNVWNNKESVQAKIIGYQYL